MCIRAKIKPNSKKGPLIVKATDEKGEIWEIFLKSPAIEGKANKEACELIAKNLNIAKTKVVLAKGLKSKVKIFNIDI